jgi:hypothetical protein
VLQSSGSYDVVLLTNNTLPAGSQLTTTLTTNPSNKVTGFAWSITRQDGTVPQSPPQTLLGIDPSITAGNLASILNYQVIMVAENPTDDGPSDSVKFSAGRGTSSVLPRTAL